MKRNDRRRGHARTLVELAVASSGTRGALGEIIEPMGLWHKSGISGR